MNFLSKTRAMVIGICFTVLGLGVLVYGTILLVNYRKPPIDLYNANTDWTTLKANQHICVDLDFLFKGWGRFDDKNKETARVYMVPQIIFEDNGNYSAKRYMITSVSPKDFEKYDSIAEKSTAWWNDTTQTVAANTESVYIDGYLRKMSSDEKKVAKQVLIESGIPAGQTDELLVPYVIMNNASSMSAFVISGAVLTVLGAGFIIWTVIRIKKDKELMNATVNHSSFSNYYGGNNFR